MTGERTFGDGGNATRFIVYPGLRGEVLVYRAGQMMGIPGEHLKQLMDDYGDSTSFRLSALRLAEAIIDRAGLGLPEDLVELARHVKGAA